MEPSIFAYIRQHSWRQQLVILVLTLLSFPPLYYSLELPKIIINQALSRPDDPHTILGYELDQVHYLYALCGIFLALVLIGGVLKYILNVYAGIVAERMLRRLRYELFSHVLRFPLPALRRVSQGELVQMINAETEALGGYVGDALAVPAFQGGTLHHHPVLHLHAGRGAGLRRDRPLPGPDVADPQAAAAGEQSGQAPGAPGAAQCRAHQRDRLGRARHPRQRRHRL